MTVKSDPLQQFYLLLTSWLPEQGQEKESSMKKWIIALVAFASLAVGLSEAEAFHRRRGRQRCHRQSNCCAVAPARCASGICNLR